MMRWMRRAATLQGHAVNPDRLWSVQWVLGVLGVFWSLLIGIFVSCGGAEHLTGQLYQPLVHTFRDYHVIGAVNILGGTLGVLGLAFDKRPLSFGSAVIGAGWNGLFAFYLIPANWSVPGGGNLVGLYALHAALVYLLRIVLLTATPDTNAVKLL